MGSAVLGGGERLRLVLDFHGLISEVFGLRHNDGGEGRGIIWARNLIAAVDASSVLCLTVPR